MKDQIKEILRVVWKYDWNWGSVKLLHAVLLAAMLPVNTILFQKIIDNILFLVQHKQAVLSMQADFGIFIAVLFAEVILTNFDNAAKKVCRIKDIYNIKTPLYNFFIKKYRTGLSDV